MLFPPARGQAEEVAIHTRSRLKRSQAQAAGPASVLAEPPDGSAGEVRHRWAALMVLCLGIFMIFLDTTIVNVAIPRIIDGIHVSLDQMLWVLNAYLLTYGVLLLTSGRLGDIFGPRNLFLVGLGIFSLASALCGLSRDGSQLIVARLIQGLGAALLTPQPLVIISRIFPADRRGLALGIFAAMGGLAAMAGPPVGGLIVSTWEWPWIFYLNVPVGIAAILLTLFLVPAIRSVGSRHLDGFGVVLASGALLTILFGLVEGERFAWGAVYGPVTIGEVIGAGVLLLAAFFFWERRQAEPLLPLPLFANRNFVIMAALSGVMAFALFGMLLVITIDLQSVLSMSALQAGLTASPLTISTTLVSPLAGRLVDRIGAQPILIFGFTLAAAGVVELAIAESATSTSFTFVLPATMMGVGMGFVFAPLITEALREVGPDKVGPAAGLLTTTRQVGSAVGTAVVGAVLQNRLAAALHERAVEVSSRLPHDVRREFVDAATAPARSGLQVGPAQVRAPIPPGVLSHVPGIEQLLRGVFADAYVAAMRPSLALPAVALLVGALACLWIRRRGQLETIAVKPRPAGPVFEGGGLPQGSVGQDSTS